MSDAHSTPPGKKPTTVYFAQQMATGLVKIGYTNNVRQRLCQLQDGGCGALTPLGTMPGGREEEAELHRRFTHLLRRGKEWFEPAEELLAYIRLNADRTSLPPLPPPRPPAQPALQAPRPIPYPDFEPGHWSDERFLVQHCGWDGILLARWREEGLRYREADGKRFYNDSWLLEWLEQLLAGRAPGATQPEGNQLGLARNWLRAHTEDRARDAARATGRKRRGDPEPVWVTVVDETAPPVDEAALARAMAALLWSIYEAEERQKGGGAVSPPPG
jgi:T5orf172 domain